MSFTNVYNQPTDGFCWPAALRVSFHGWLAGFHAYGVTVVHVGGRACQRKERMGFRCLLVEYTANDLLLKDIYQFLAMADYKISKPTSYLMVRKPELPH